MCVNKMQQIWSMLFTRSCISHWYCYYRNVLQNSYLSYAVF